MTLVETCSIHCVNIHVYSTSCNMILQYQKEPRITWLGSSAQQVVVGARLLCLLYNVLFFSRYWSRRRLEDVMVLGRDASKFVWTSERFMTLHSKFGNGI